MNTSYFLDLEAIYSAIFNFLFGGHAVGYVYNSWDIFYYWIRIIGWSAGVIFLILIFIFKMWKAKVTDEEDKKYKVAESSDIEVESPAKEIWQGILDHLNSTNPNDWKVAILDADSILDDMVKKMGYKGDNLGERLKNIEKSDFETLDSAWEAHKIRNRIAHAGSDFVLTQREANRAIDMYRQVFEEFRYI